MTVTLDADPLPRFTPEKPHWVWFVGCHGGAGESTLADVLPGSAAAGHRWPIGQPVVLVARTNERGLLAARSALIQWSSAHGPEVDLLGLILSADAPIRLPRALIALAHLVAGGSPRTWRMPWIPAWRTGERADHKITARLFADIAELTDPEEKK